MYDESTVFFALSMSTEDYFVVMQLAKRKNMTRSQFILDCIRQVVLKEQEEWQKSMANPKPKDEKKDKKGD
jgi:hypothetical protein